MINIKREKILWQGRPSVILYIGTYILSIILLIACYRLENIIYPGDYYPGFSAFFTDYLFITPIHEWPFSNSRFVGIFILQCAQIVISIKMLYRVFQTTFTHYTLTNQRIIIKTFSLIGISSQEMELYRIIDVVSIKPFPILIFGLSHIDLKSNDSFTPQITLQGLLGGKQIYKIIWSQVSRHREDYHQLMMMPTETKPITPTGTAIAIA